MLINDYVMYTYMYMCHVMCVGGESGESGESEEFAAGDVVRVDLDMEIVKLMQEGHGGWTEAMTSVRDITLRLQIFKWTNICGFLFKVY